MRSFNWRDYFSQEEFESQLGDLGIQEKIVQIMSSNLDTVFEYDTDSGKIVLF